MIDKLYNKEMRNFEKFLRSYKKRKPDLDSLTILVGFRKIITRVYDEEMTKIQKTKIT